MADALNWLKKLRPEAVEGQELDQGLVPDLGPGPDHVPAPEEVTRIAPNLGAVAGPLHPRIAPHAPEAGAQDVPDLGRLTKMELTLRMEIAIPDRVPNRDLGPGLVQEAPTMMTTKKFLHFQFFFPFCSVIQF